MDTLLGLLILIPILELSLDRFDMFQHLPCEIWELPIAIRHTADNSTREKRSAHLVNLNTWQGLALVCSLQPFLIFRFKAHGRGSVKTWLQ